MPAMYPVATNTGAVAGFCRVPAGDRFVRHCSCDSPESRARAAAAEPAEPLASRGAIASCRGQVRPYQAAGHLF